MNSNTKKWLHYILRAQATAVAILDISLAIHSLHTGQAHKPDGTNFSGDVTVLVTNILLTVGIFADLDLFLCIWLFVYGSFWLVAMFVAPEAYPKLPGISHFIAKTITEEYDLDKYYRPIMYTCLKLISVLVIILLMFVRRKTFKTDTSSQTPLLGSKRKYGTQTRRNRYKRVRTSYKRNLTSNGHITTEPVNTSNTSSRKQYIDCIPKFGKGIATTNHSNSSSLTESTETLVEKFTSTPSVANMRVQQSTDFVTIPDDASNQLNQSEDWSFDVLQCKI